MAAGNNRQNGGNEVLGVEVGYIRQTCLFRHPAHRQCGSAPGEKARERKGCKSFLGAMVKERNGVGMIDVVIWQLGCLSPLSPPGQRPMHGILSSTIAGNLILKGN